VTHGRPDIDLSVHTRKFLTQLLEIQLLLGFVVRPASVVVQFTLGDVYVLKLLRTVTFYVM
jgi:hypothetical protein